MYEYYGMDITPAIMKTLLIKLFDGKQFQRNDAINEIIKFHKENGGITTNKNYTACFKSATKHLKDKGLVNRGYGIWRLNYEKKGVEIVETINKNLIKYQVDEEIGEGDSSIYVYYYDIYREYAILKGKKYYPCKIGRTDRAPLQRVFGQCGTCYPELPHIALIIHCEDSSKLENALHSIMKFQNKWIETAPGVEWFITNPEEIKRLYVEINKR